MKVRVKYKGRRAETMKKIKMKGFVAGPYDFSKGECLMEEKDADEIIRRSPIGFEVAATAEEVAAEKAAPAK